MRTLDSQVRAFYSKIWNKQDLSVVPDVLHKDFEFRGSLGMEKNGCDEFKEYVLYVHAGLSSYRCRIDEMVVDKQQVFAKMEFSGVHTAEFMGYRATDRSVSWAGAALFTFRGDKVAKLWVLGDLVNLNKQLAGEWF